MPAPTAQIQLQPQQLNDLNVILQQQALLQQLQQLQAQAQFANSGDDGLNSTDKKPKLNFVISSPAPVPPFSQFGSVGGGAQPQIQLQLMPGGASTGATTGGASITTNPQPAQQFNAAALLSSLTGTPVVGGNGAVNLLSPNKCFLPITIRDENSDQQIVAHIDTKNLVLPTTYQVQMKVSRHILLSNRIYDLVNLSFSLPAAPAPISHC